MKNKKNEPRILVSERDLNPFVQPKLVSISWKLLTYFLFVSFVPTLAIGYFTVQRTEFFLQQELSTRLEATAHYKASEISDWVDHLKSDLEKVPGEEVAMMDAMDAMMEKKTPESRDDLRSQLDHLLDHSSSLFEISVLHPETGQVMVSTNQAEERIMKGDRDYFVEGKNSTYLYGPYFSKVLGRQALTLSLPLEGKEGDLAGVLAARIDFDSLSDLIVSEIDFGSTGQAYLVNRSYQLVGGLTKSKRGFLADSSDSLSQVDLPLYVPPVIEALSGRRGVYRYANFEGSEVIGFSRFVPEFQTVLVVEQHVSEAFLPIVEMRSALIKVLLFVLLVVFLIGYVIAANIVTPLQKLSKSVKSIADGDYKALAEFANYEEVRVLALAFNDMIKKLVISLSKTENLIETMPNAMFTLDINGKIASVNESALSLTEFSRSDLIGKVFTEVVKCLNQEGDSFSIYDEIKANKGRLNDYQISCYTKFHKALPISVSASELRGENEELAGYIMVIKDLRELKRYARERVQKITPLLHQISLGDFSQRVQLTSKEDEFTDLMVSVDLMASNLRELIEENQHKTSELESSNEKLEVSHEKLESTLGDLEEEKARAEALLASIGEGIIAIDLEGKILLINHEAEKMFKKSIDEVLGKTYGSVYQFEDDKNRRIESEIFTPPGVVMGKSSTIFFKSGDEEAPFSTTVSPIQIDGKTVGRIITFRDITEEMEIDKAKSEFVSLASHQLRTPLTGIKWMLQEVIRKGNMTEDQAEYLDDAFRSNERMIALVNDLLNVSRLEAGAVAAVSEKTNMVEFIELLVKETIGLAKEKKQKVEFIQPSEPIEITVDQQLISEVIGNLISNALYYSDPGKTVQVSVKKDGKTMDVIVKDEGIGISEEDQEKLFTKFFRSQEAAKRSTTGSGLGLYIVQKVLELCSGTIRVESEVGKGTAFIVTLPVKGPKGKTQGKGLIPKKLFSPLKLKS